MKLRHYVILPDLLTAKGPSKREEFFYFSERTLQAVQGGDWKTHFITEHCITAEMCAALPCEHKCRLHESRQRPNRPHTLFRWAYQFAPLLGVWIALLVCGGCASLARNLAKDRPRQVGATDVNQPIMSAELDELTRAFADRYVGLLASTCDALKKDNPDLIQRREAQMVMTDCATNIYDIASNADAFTRMLDLVVVTSLVSQVWIDDDRAWEVFADRGEVLVRALHHGRVEAWALAAQVLRPDQLDLLDYLLWDWRRHNPDMVRASFVRFSNFAIGRGMSANAEVLAAGGLSGSIGQAGKAVAEARLLTERMFYLLKRESTLLRWQMETLRDDILATPEVGNGLTDFHRLTDQVEQLPKNVATERQAILGALTEANGVVTSLGQTSNSLNEMLKTADGLIARYDSVDRKLSRPFDIREYTEAVKELTVTTGKMNDMLKSSNELLGSSEWDRRIQQVSQSADERIKMAAEQSQRVVHDAFWRAYVALGFLFVMLIICLATAFVLMLRLIRRVASKTAGLRSEGDHTADHKAGPATNARSAGRKEMSE
jgi:hypothetical protein